ncbi:MAG: hypothetical protein B6U89_04670 [Desulfurococcales archaeon ex4484_58]|nr:MAG: hypothetical protein B6U89_04670 [Desulfurococcales archaeon ex4484_58]
MPAKNKPGLKDILGLPKLERLIMEYFIKHISVGEIIAVLELRDEIKRLKDPELVPEFDDIIIELEINKALARLVEKGFLEHVGGCYNLAEHLRREIKEKLGSLQPGISKNLNELIK